MASAGGAAGPVGGWPAEDEISEVEMEIIEPPKEEAEQVGMKRARGSLNTKGSKGFIGVTTAQEKPTPRPHNNVKFLKKGGNGNLVDDTSKMGGLYLHGAYGSQTVLDSDALSQQPEVKWAHQSIHNAAEQTCCLGYLFLMEFLIQVRLQVHMRSQGKIVMKLNLALI